MPTRAEDARRFWDALPDADFFGPKVRHVYMYSSVSTGSALALRDELTCSKDRRPIVVHVHSYGGDMDAENWILSMFDRVCVPLCVMVDGVSASAATILSVLAPYRVVTPLSLCPQTPTLNLKPPSGFNPSAPPIRIGMLPSKAP